MSKVFLFCKDDIKMLLNHLSKERVLITPDDNSKSYKSIKEFFFPQNELMFSFHNDDISENENITGYVIFGARPCDLEALRVMSIVYTTGEYKDLYFKRHLDANLVIGIGCSSQKPGCFCSEMGIDPKYSDFCDIMLVEEGDNYSVVHLSEKGKNALKIITDKTEAQSLCLKTEALSSCLMLNSEQDDNVYFDIIDWEKETKACKGCGICTYICPTCYCFDFKDITEKGVSKRYKCWDSCMYPKFTLHASGHNPREDRYKRYRQRVLHKYKYVPDNFNGVVACTGCGRCIRSCPVGINIKNIVKQIISKLKTEA